MKNMLINYKKHAKKNSYKYGYKRDRNNVIGIVIHYTGVKGDTAKNNAKFFATYNERSAGAHLFIDATGYCSKSVNLNEIAWSVGDSRNGHGTMYNTLNNSNTVSIELCDMIDHEPTAKQKEKLIRVIKYIKKY